MSKRQIAWKLCNNTFFQKGKLEKAQAELQKQQEILDTQMLVNVMKGIDVNNAQQQHILQQIQAITGTDLFKNFHQDLQKSIHDLQDQILDQIRSDIQSSTHDIKKHVLDQAEETRQDAKRIRLVDQHQSHVQQLLDSLRFPTMFQREESIRKAHEATFNRVFEHNKRDEWHEFVQWLENENGLFWINGKLGSGKSTLVNFIVKHAKLSSSLRTWAAGAKVIISKFFFWRAGSTEQKSVNGMLRSFLFQLISSHPEFAREAPTEDWSIHLWTFDRLERLLTSILRRQDTAVRMCFCIDGLDEFDGDADGQDQLVSLVINISCYSNVKVLASSRPEPFIETSLRPRHQLRLEDLTYDDIRNYVHERLSQETNPKFRDRFEPPDIYLLSNEITLRATGVFLWAHLAVMEIVRGIRARDSMPVLWERLSTLSPSMNGLFAQLIGKIDRVHQKSAARLLQLAIRWIAMPYANRVGLKMPLLFTAFAVDDEFSSKMNKILITESLDETKKMRYRQHLEDFRLSAITWAAGLFVTHQIKGGRSSTGRCACNFTFGPTDTLCLTSHYFSDHIVLELVHRSALEFLLEDGEAKKFMSQSLWDVEDVDEAIIRAHCNDIASSFMLLKELCSSTSYDSESSENVWKIVQCVENKICSYLIGTLQDVGRFRNPVWRRERFDLYSAWLENMTSSIVGIGAERVPLYVLLGRLLQGEATNTLFQVASPNCLFLNALVQTENFEWACESLSTVHQPSMIHICYSAMRWIVPNVDIGGLHSCNRLIAQLLHLGLNPNTAWQLVNVGHVVDRLYRLWTPATTIWQTFLSSVLFLMMGRASREPNGFGKVMMDVVGVFLAHGAAVDTKVSFHIKGERSGEALWTIRQSTSSRRITNLLHAFSRTPNDQIHMWRGQLESWLLNASMIERIYYVSRGQVNQLRHVTTAQQGRLLQVSKDTILGEIYGGSRVWETFDIAFAKILGEIWRENEEHILPCTKEDMYV